MVKLNPLDPKTLSPFAKDAPVLTLLKYRCVILFWLSLTIFATSALAVPDISSTILPTSTEPKVSSTWFTAIKILSNSTLIFQVNTWIWPHSNTPLVIANSSVILLDW